MGNLVVLGVNAWNEPKEVISKFVKEHQLQHKILLDGATVKDQYGVTAVPTVFWIDDKGIIRDLEASSSDFASLKERTQRLMQSHSTSAER